MGSSMSAAIPAAYYLESHGFAAEVVETSEWLHFGAGWPRAGAAVLVSRSGETIEIVKLLPKASAAGQTIGVTNVRGTKLDRDAKHSIFINSDADRMVAIQTYTGTMATLLLLAAAVVEEPEAKWRAALAGADGCASKSHRAGRSAERRLERISRGRRSCASAGTRTFARYGSRRRSALQRSRAHAISRSVRRAFPARTGGNRGQTFPRDRVCIAGSRRARSIWRWRAISKAWAVSARVCQALGSSLAL